MKSAITVSLTPEAKGGPFVYWFDLDHAFQDAASLGFDAIEIFAPSAEAVDVAKIQSLKKEHGLNIAALGTGGGWLIHQWHLTHPDVEIRKLARQFITSIINRGAELDAPAIIGSMQGRHGNGVTRDQAVQWLAEALDELGDHAASLSQPLFYEPLNRYETNLFNRQLDAAEFLNSLATNNVKILADLFHMNIEEPDPAQALRDLGPRLGHVHFVDSNRWAAGFGHTDFKPLFAALKEIQYTGYLSAEAFALPDSTTGAQKTIATFRQFCAHEN